MHVLDCTKTEVASFNFYVVTDPQSHAAGSMYVIAKASLA